MPLDLPSSGDDPNTPNRPATNIPGAFNPKRIQNATKNTTVKLLAYVSTPTGSPYGDQSAISGTHTFQFAKQFGPTLGTYTTLSLSAVVQDAKGWSGSPDNVWNPAIDGDEGYNVAVTVPAENFTEIGLYTLRMEVSSNEGTFHQIWDIRVNG